MTNLDKNKIRKFLHFKNFPLLITFLILLISFISIASLNAGILISLDVDKAVIREEPATNSPAIAEINSQTNLQLLQEEGGWYKVAYNGNIEGYIAKWLVEQDNLDNDQNLSAEVKQASPLYSKASEDSEELVNVASGEYVQINYESKGWAQVSYMNYYGYLPTGSLHIIHSKDMPQEIKDLLAIQAAQRQYDEEFESQDKIVYVRQSNQGFYNQPDIFSELIYTPENNQRFELIDIIQSEDGSTDYYFVEDEDGLRGYIETRVAARGSEYMDHVGTTNPGSIENALIVIDPGHGGEDPGAISYDNQIHEKVATLSTALFLKDYLEDLGAQVQLTRDGDYWVDLEDRAQMSNEYEADAFLSLHFDASPYPEWHGITTYYFHEADYEIAQNINQELSQLDLPNNGVNFGNYLVIRENERPSLLLELGYMSNSFDLEYIRSNEYHKNVAQAIGQGLVNYFNP